MKRAFLLTGFNNWGKTTLIYEIFHRSRFYYGSAYEIPGINNMFTVDSHSNDDVGEEGFIKAIKERLAASPTNGKDIFCTLCPTRDPHNNSLRILQGKPFSLFDEIHILLLKYKWDFHAELRIKDVQNYLSRVSNASFFVIDAGLNQITDTDRFQARNQQIINYLMQIYP